MQYCLYVNPTLDKTVEVGKLEPGKTNRAQDVRVEAGGKAVNVARVLKALGGNPKVVGFVYNNGGDVVKNALEDRSIFYDFHDEEGIPRVNLKIVDKSAGNVTEINEIGMNVSSELLSRIADELVDTVSAGDAAILTGGLPLDAPADYYAGLIRRLKEKSVMVYLDASGDALRAGVQEGPFLIKPNLVELEEATGKTIATIGQALDAARDLIARYGIHYVVVSFGSKGSLAVDAEAAVYAPGLSVSIGSTVGAGDSLLAGIIARSDASLIEMLKSGVAAATGSVSLPGTDLCTKSLYDEYIEEITITEDPDLSVSVVD